MMQHVIIVHFHELSLKGRNRSWFEKILLKNIKRHLFNLPYKKIRILFGRIVIENININLWNQYNKVLSDLIGIRNFILASETPLDIEQIKTASLKACKSENILGSFRVSARRQNKNFVYNSQDINQIVGEYIQKNTGFEVNLTSPKIDVLIEIVNKIAFVGTKKVDAYGGLPVGTGESALSLISSGIDSPVASFNIIKRGVTLDYIHFHSSPVTNMQSIYNVENILKELCRYQMNCKLYLFPLLDIQNLIMEKVDSKYWVILFRRVMIKISNLLASKNGYKVLVTGENIGQVASQTLSNIVAVEDASKIPIIRPLAGYNKEEIVIQAEKIGTYAISIEPYQDCCSYFIPPNPETKAKLEQIQQLEQKVDLSEIINNYNENLEIKEISFYE
jgi:thiamine biosynthesis protein ThiI